MTLKGRTNRIVLFMCLWYFVSFIPFLLKIREINSLLKNFPYIVQLDRYFVLLDNFNQCIIPILLGYTVLSLYSLWRKKNTPNSIKDAKIFKRSILVIGFLNFLIIGFLNFLIMFQNNFIDKLLSAGAKVIIPERYNYHDIGFLVMAYTWIWIVYWRKKLAVSSVIEQFGN